MLERLQSNTNARTEANIDLNIPERIHCDNDIT
jgi:hypothetical protein